VLNFSETGQFLSARLKAAYAESSPEIHSIFLKKGFRRLKYKLFYVVHYNMFCEEKSHACRD